MHQLRGQPLPLSDLEDIAWGARVEIAPDALARMKASERAVGRIAASHLPAYGINTGFGKLCEIRIEDGEIEQLQLNLVRSHACGLGAPLSEGETRVLMALRANTLALGYSGARPELALKLAELLNLNVLPVIPEKGSVGASGDLAPLAHLALVVIGEGEAVYRGQRLPGGDALRRAGLQPLKLRAKEGLALLNGTQALTAVGALALWRAFRVVGLADAAGAMTLQALRGAPAAFDPRIHETRPHPGQALTARRLRALLEGSDVDPAWRATPAPVQVNPIVLSPSISPIPPGTNVQVKVINFPPNAPVNIGIGRPGMGYQIVNAGITDAAGTLVTSITVPEVNNPLEQWTVVVITTSGTPASAASPPFTIGQ